MADERPKQETDNCRHRLLKYCQGQGLDLGCGWTKIKLDAVGVDLANPTADVQMDARLLKGFPNSHYDYVYSSHLLEEIENTEETLKEWFRVLKPGGYLVLYQVDKDYYYPIGHELCNKSHKHHFFGQDLWEIIQQVENSELIHQERMREKTNEWSFELVVRKKDPKASPVEKIEISEKKGISILVPTLGRTKAMDEFSRCVDKMSFHPQNVEICFGIHPDDTQSFKKIEELESQLKISLKGISIERYPDGKPHLSYLWNELYKKASYDIVGFFGDDVRFRTPGWDVEVITEFEKDKTVLVSCNDVHIQKGHQAVLFFTHKYVHNKIGFYLNPRYRRWCIDTFLDQIYRKAGKLHYREDIVTEHLHPIALKQPGDSVYQALEQFVRADELTWSSQESRDEIDRYANIIRGL